MALRQRALGYRGRRHAAAGTPEHAEDKAIAATRRATTWVPVGTAPGEGREGHSPAHPLGLGFQFRVTDGTLSLCSDDDYVTHLDHVENTRNWYWGEMSRKGKKTTVRRKRPGAVEQVAASFAPWQSEFLRYTAELQGGRFVPHIRNLYETIAEKTATKLHEMTGRDVVGVSLHLDSSTDHVHLQFSRVSTENKLLGEHRGLHTAGGWLAGVKRQIDAGGVPDDSEKFRVFTRNMASFSERNEGEIPLEIALNNVVDAEFDRVFGNTEFAQRCRENYAMAVMDTESAVLEKEAEELESRAQAIREEIALRDTEIYPVEPVRPMPRPASPSLPDLPGSL